MTRQAISTLVIASIVTAAGCQTASRWAWWNRDDASTVAQSTAPTLPSQAATPQAVEVPGLEPTSSPSAANLAAAQSPTNASNPALPATPAGSLANVPLANYPASYTAPAVSNTLPASATPASAPPAAAIASVPPSGPYDPNGYKPSESAETSVPFDPSGANPLRTAAAVDRYALPNAGTSVAQMDSAYALASASPTSDTPPAATDRYALASEPETGSNSSLAAPKKSASEAAFANSPAASQPSAVTNAMDVAPAPSATVRLSTPAGKYRPGGTSDYSGASASPPIEVAARPPAVQPASSERPSDPWSPPAGSTPASSGTIGTY
jgi:hypothetical protein